MSRRDLLRLGLIGGLAIGGLPLASALANGDGGKVAVPPPVGVLLVSMIVPPADMPTTLPAVAIWHVDVPPNCGVHWNCTETACTWVDAVHLLEGQYDCWFEGRVRLYRYGQTPCDLDPGSEFSIQAGDSFLALDRMLASSIVNPGPDPAREFTASIYASYPKINQGITMDDGIHVQPCGGLTPGEWFLMPDPPVAVTYRQVLMPPGSAFGMGEDELVFRYVDLGSVERICLDSDATILESSTYSAGEPIAHRYWTPEGLQALTNKTSEPAVLLEIAMTTAPDRDTPLFLEGAEQ
jgi:hypothetical protein